MSYEWCDYVNVSFFFSFLLSTRKTKKKMKNKYHFCPIKLTEEKNNQSYFYLSFSLKKKKKITYVLLFFFLKLSITREIPLKTKTRLVNHVFSLKRRGNNCFFKRKICQNKKMKCLVRK